MWLPCYLGAGDQLGDGWEESWPSVTWQLSSVFSHCSHWCWITDNLSPLDLFFYHTFISTTRASLRTRHPTISLTFKDPFGEMNILPGLFYRLVSKTKLMKWFWILLINYNCQLIHKYLLEQRVLRHSDRRWGDESRKLEALGASLVVPWLRLHLLVQGVPVHTLVRELRSHKPCSQNTKA